MTTINRASNFGSGVAGYQGGDEIGNLINSGNLEGGLAQLMAGLSSSDAKAFLSQLKNDGRIPQSTINNLQNRFAQQGGSEAQAPARYRASAGEVSSRMAEMGVGGMSQQIALNNMLNAKNAGSSGVKYFGGGEHTAAPATKSTTPDWLANPKFDQAFYEKLADLPDKDLKKWYSQHPELQKDLRENYNLLGDAKMDPTVRTKLEKLGERLQKLHDEHFASPVLDKFRNRTQNDIAKEYIDRIQTAANTRNGAVDRQREIKDIMTELKLLSQTDRSNGATYANAMAAFKQAMAHREPNRYVKGGSPTIPMAEVVDAAVGLEGPGSGAVKADLIDAMVQQKRNQQVEKVAQEMPKLPKEMLDVLKENAENGPELLKKMQKLEKHAGEAKNAWEMMKQISTKIEDEPNPGAYIEQLIKSDPGRVVREFETRAGENPRAKIVLDDALKSVYLAHRKDPDKAAEVVGEMLGSSARDLAEASQQRPLDLDKIQSLGQTNGFMLRSAQTMVETIAADKKKMIDEGAFIAKIFGKGVSKVSGFPVIEKAVNKVVDKQKDKEYKGVDAWQKGMESGFRDFMDAVFIAGKPKAAPDSDMMNVYKDALQRYHRGMEEGIGQHRSFEERQN